MKSATGTTLLMLLVAGILVVAAAYFYPWPTQQVTVNRVNEPLFEEYDTNEVELIQIEQSEFVDSQTGVIQKFGLELDDKRWLMVDRGFFPAESGLIPVARNSLNNLLIEELTTEDRKDYGLYGVHEPDSEATSGKGKLFELRASDGEVVASLIVGESPENQPDKRYVRIPGQPQVYLVSFPGEVLSTTFADWVSTDLMRMTDAEKRAIKSFRMHNYFADPASFAENGTIKHRYVVEINNRNQRFQAEITEANAQGELNDESKSLQLPRTNDQDNWLIRVASLLSNTPFIGVKPKQDLIASYLISPNKDAKPIEFSALIGNGFFFSGMENEQHQFRSTAGEFSVLKQNGVRLTIYFGNFADAERGLSGELSRYAMMVAEFVPEEFPSEKPEPADNDDRETQDDYQRSLAKWQKERDEAIKNAEDFNRYHAKWIYVIPDRVYQSFLPSVETLK